MNKIELMYSSFQARKIKEKVLTKISEIIDHGQFIHGPELKRFEQEASNYVGNNHAVSCANGTDALTIALMAIDLQPNEIVFTPSFTFVATAEAISLIGGTAYFVDVNPQNFNICLVSLERSIKTALDLNLKIKAILSVDLFGNPASHNELNSIAKKYGLYHISDAAQSFGSIYKGKKTGSLADITTTSFFPTKPLGCYGDGGMVFTNDAEIANKISSICFHGKGQDKYQNIRIGMNSRLDTIQAAILSEKLKFFDEELEHRNELARFYNENLGDLIKCPHVEPYAKSSWAVYTLQHPLRDLIIEEMNKVGIPSNIYYKTPLHGQIAYKKFPRVDKLNVSEKLSNKVFCLPMHGYVTKKEQEYIVVNLREILIKIGNISV